MSSAVTPTRPAISSITGIPVHALVPKSPCSARQIQVGVLRDQRLIEAELVTQRRQPLRRRVRRAEHHLRRVAGHQADHQEGQHRHSERDEQQLADARRAEPGSFADPGLPQIAQRARSDRRDNLCTSSRRAVKSVP